MATASPAWTMSEWQTLAAQAPAQAGRELARRLQTALSPEQHRAVFATNPSEETLIEAFERVANTIAPLAGVPYALKDIFFTANDPLLAGSKFPPGVIPTRPKDSKLPHALQGFGAVLAGKTQLYEFAYGLTGENEHYGDCMHPQFPDRTSGGSSSGSAAAVAAGIVPVGVGTDTAGSIRVPAAFCGLFGFRTSAGHALIADAFPLGPSFDTAGWFTRSPQDMLTLNRFLLGRPAQIDRSPRGCYLGFNAFGITADQDVEKAYTNAASQIALPADRESTAQLQNSFAGSAESYAVLQSIEAYHVHAKWLDERRSDYSPKVWARIDRGRNWNVDQQQRAQARRTVIKHTWASFFMTYDYLVLPIAPFPALTKADSTQENRDRLLTLATPASLGGLPALTIPIRLPSGLTTGMQIIVNDPLSPVISWLLSRR
ncbi:MAG TPA: amidase [Opitutaceae bacterium]|nr:amidase [Opitutaceae bacterium]